MIEAPDSDVSLEDLAQLGSTAASQRRLVERRFSLTKRRPQPPRGVSLTGNILTWSPPQDEAGITHYRIYADDDNTPVSVVPVGKLNADGFVGTKLFVSSYNSNNEQESPKVLYDGAATAQVGGPYRMTGIANGSNAVFTAPYAPTCVFVDGILQEPGADSFAGDYRQSGKTVTFNANSIPQMGAKVLCM